MRLVESQPCKNPINVSTKLLRHLVFQRQIEKVSRERVVMQSEEKGGEKVPKNSRNIDPGMKMTQCLKNTKNVSFFKH